MRNQFLNLENSMSFLWGEIEDLRTALDDVDARRIRDSPRREREMERDLRMFFGRKAEVGERLDRLVEDMLG